MKKSTQGFTIVELLVVIVVIAILAVIVILVFSGLRQRAIVSVLKNDLSSAARTLEADKVLQDGYPATAAEANGGNGLRLSKEVSVEYTSGADRSTYCLTATQGDVAFYISNTNKSPTEGYCEGHSNPNSAPEVVEIVKGTHTASETGVYQINTDLQPDDLVLIVLRKSPYGTVWMNVYGQDRSPFYNKSVPVGATERTVAYSVTGLSGPGEVRMTQASTSLYNHLVIYVIRGIKSPTSVATQEYISTGVTPAGQYTTQANIGKGQVAIFARMTLSGTTQQPIALSPGGWVEDDATPHSTHKQTYTAHYIASDAANLQATTTLSSSNYILQVIFVIGP